MKVALYARYSTDNQRDASIADQFRVCRAYAEKQGWQIVEEYSDHAISGASLLRAGVQALIAEALRGRFQVVLAEAMDRLSRDQEDIAGLFKRMAYGNVKIVTLSEGEVTHLHVGLKGTMNVLPLLADLLRQGHHEGSLNAPEPQTFALMLLQLRKSVARVMHQALQRSEAGDIDGAVKLLDDWMATYGIAVDRLLKLPEGTVQVADAGFARAFLTSA